MEREKNEVRNANQRKKGLLQVGEFREGRADREGGGEAYFYK